MNTRSFARSTLVALTLVSATVLYACGGGSDGGKNGGNSSGGGSTGEGGSAAGGGAGDGSGGSAAGNDGQGGTPATGGTKATGGTSAGTGGTPTGTGGTPAGTGGTPSANAPICPVAGNCKLLAVGDALAAGVGAPPGYLQLVATHIKKKKTGFEWVGSKGTGANKHEGVDKQLSSALVGTIEAIITATMPNIVVLNTGSEDAQQSMQVGLGARVKQIIEKIRAARPGTYVLVTGLSRTPDTSQYNSQIKLPLPQYTSSAFTTRAFAGEKEIEAMVDGLADPRVRFIRFNFAPQYASGAAGKSGPVSGNYFSSGYYPNAAGYTNMSNFGIGVALTPLIHH